MKTKIEEFRSVGIGYALFFKTLDCLKIFFGFLCLLSLIIYGFEFCVLKKDHNLINMN